MLELYNFGEGLNHRVNLETLPETPFVVDAGACIGAFCKAMTELRPGCSIIAIEPSRHNLPLLYEMVHPMSNVTPIEKALGGADGEIEMHDVHGENRKFYQWSSTQKERAEMAVGRSGFKHINSYTVPVVTLKTLIGGRRIDYLKMDIEGAEEQVFESMTEEEAKLISQLSLEYHGNLEQVSRHLERLGFAQTIFDKESEIYAYR